MTHAEIAVTCTAHAFGIRGPDILSKSRSHNVAKARQAVAWILRTHANASFPEIAKAIGYADHSSARCAFYNAADLIKVGDVFATRLRQAEQDFLTTTTAKAVKAV